MLYGIEETTPTTSANVVSTADLKAFLRVTHSTEDALIESIRVAALAYVEQFCNIRIGDRTAIFHFSDFPDAVELPVGPINSITYVDYATGADTTARMSSSDYYVTDSRLPMIIKFKNIPSVFADSYKKLQITVSLGYTEATVPEGIKHAIKLLVSHMYDQRAPEVTGTITNKLKIGLESLLNPYRIISFR
tara:strand:+ start:3995 stop:4567 length:573 start_codon:yes stop_codon:yes gene_type:complete